MSKKSLSNSNPSTYITQIKEGSVIKGNMESPYSIRVDGFITGDLLSQEKIIVGSMGEIGGNLSGGDISIEGYINGDVMANGQLQLSASAKVYGSIFARQIIVENGAELNGKVTVGKEIELPEFTARSPSRSSKMVSSSTKDQNAKDKYGNVAW